MTAPPFWRVDGERLKEARYRAMLTQEKLAEKSGVSLATIKGIEEQGRRIKYLRGQRAATVVLLANAVQVTAQSLLCITYPQSNPHGNEGGKQPGNEGGKTGGNSHVTSPVGFDLDLGVELDLEPDTTNAESALDLKAPRAATNGNGKSQLANVLDALNLGLVESLWSSHQGWDRSVSFAYLHALVSGSEKRGIPAFGARAVNAAIDDLYANAADVPNPAGYLRERAESHAQSHTQGVRG